MTVEGTDINEVSALVDVTEPRSLPIMFELQIHVVVATPDTSAHDGGIFLEGAFIDPKEANKHARFICSDKSETQYSKREVEVHETILRLPDELCLILSNDYADGSEKPIPEGICLSDKAALKHIKLMLKNTDPHKGPVYEKHEMGYKQVLLLN